MNYEGTLGGGEVVVLRDDYGNFLHDIVRNVVPGLRELLVEEEVVSRLHTQKAARQQLRRGDVVSRVNTKFRRCER